MTSGFSGRCPTRLAVHSGHNAVGGPLHELESKGATDAVAHEKELPDAEVVHQPQLVIRKGTPRVVDRNRPGGLAAGRVALVHRNAAEVVLECLHSVEHRGGPIADAGVQASTGSDQEREARSGLLVADADVALCIKRHGSLSLHSVAWCAYSYSTPHYSVRVIGGSTRYAIAAAGPWTEASSTLSRKRCNSTAVLKSGYFSASHL